jgi:hypothetical protein
MSGSFQRPGPANGASSSCSKPIVDMDCQSSAMSPVVRHRLPPASAPHFQTSARPYWQMLKTIGRPVARSASAILRYTAGISASS